MSDISIIICTHNPRPDYLRRVLEALQAQTLPKEQWELLLIDNASKEPLASTWDLSWHPHARHLREDELGLTPARLRGIKESTGDLLVFVDDDNVLAHDYLEQARAIGDAWAVLGAWGGQSQGCFDAPPPEWTRPFWRLIAIHEFVGDHWANLRDHNEVLPCGAGMVVRRSVAVVYAQKARSDSIRMGLDRKGGALTSSGDTDLAYTSMDLGLGTGLFEFLRVTHLIPANRTTESYLLNLSESGAFSWVILDSLRGRVLPRPSLGKRILDLLRLVRLDSRSRRFELARRRGREKARRFLQKPQ